jgi:hypothetical protein
MRAYIHHITKVDFFGSFFTAFSSSFGEKNIRAGFLKAGLVPFNPEAVVCELDISLRTPTTPHLPIPVSEAWVSKTPHNPNEATSQSDFIKGKVARHQDSSPTPIYESVAHLKKSAKRYMHRLALVENRVKTIEEANHIVSTRRRAKKSRISEEGFGSVHCDRDLRH